jgi:hypothetical protein
MFDRSVSNMYKNNIFLHFPVLWWRFTILQPISVCYTRFSVKMTPTKLTLHFVGKTILRVKIVFLVFSLVLDEICLNEMPIISMSLYKKFRSVITCIVDGILSTIFCRKEIAATYSESP